LILHQRLHIKTFAAMALINISGYPCSGKTTRAKQIQAMLQERQSLPVLLLNDETQNISKQAYDCVLLCSLIFPFLVLS
jgi:tRNA uridine 5-carbamoylmethylation protein Kti12